MAESAIAITENYDLDILSVPLNHFISVKHQFSDNVVLSVS